MSEYWKSTPKYWCKHCKTYVRDTPLERSNHEATPRHQGAISRFLKELHRSNEREARDAQRAKDEAARLNGLAPGSSLTKGSGSAPLKSSGDRGGASQAKATPEDRKRQLAQLAALGVAVPEEYRRENAMAGEWQQAESEPTGVLQAPRMPLGQRIKAEPATPSGIKQEDPTDPTIGLGELGNESRKRSPDDEVEGLVFNTKRRPKWGTDIKAYKKDQDDDLDALLDSTPIIRKEPKNDAQTISTYTSRRTLGNEGGNMKSESADIKSENVDTKSESVDIKKEEDTESKVSEIPSTDAAQASTSLSADNNEVGSLFKKRKSKIRG